MEKGVKNDQEKPRLDLIPSSTLFSLGKVFAFGAEKYDDRNWEKGIEYGRLFAALMRHMWAWWRGEEKDYESGYSHLDHALCCLSMLKEMTQIHPELDDRPARLTIDVNSNEEYYKSVKSDGEGTLTDLKFNKKEFFESVKRDSEGVVKTSHTNLKLNEQ